MVSAFYSLGSRDTTGEPARAGGVHLIARDAAGADELMDGFSPISDRGAIGTVGRLGAPPLSAEGAAAYLSDIAIGTEEEFAAAFDAYSGAGPDWDLHASRGHLAIVIGTQVRANVLRYYPKAVTV
ncbi:hypothetical protein E1293_24020 [Actinomadura darangshiensis]|uniref:Uncharacterized protein n=1 Tax=Actinomadura darangshiensis TaxID=705336 RepID=A0A4R5B0V9_9ACTN|nr:hypothetical protein [Actinomadura darangshiensis]TDD79221.1 hypothetical protein E1293_24020 [Actinomadura darangshiensis]